MKKKIWNNRITTISVHTLQVENKKNQKIIKAPNTDPESSFVRSDIVCAWGVCVTEMIMNYFVVLPSYLS